MSAASSLFGPRALLHRFLILRNTFLDHQFERRSPLEPVPDNVMDLIYSVPITLPPRKHVERAGGQTLEGLIFLASLAKLLEAKQMFEFGTFNGTTTWTLARNVPGAVTHTLDLPPDTQPLLQLEATDQVVRTLFERHLYSELPHDSQVVQLWGDSAEFDPSAYLGQCDLVYVDGAHSEPYVRVDTGNALSMISETGIVVWDDYWREVAGVREVLHEMVGDAPIFRVPRTRLVIRLSEPAKRRLILNSRSTVSS